MAVGSVAHHFALNVIGQLASPLKSSPPQRPDLLAGEDLPAAPVQRRSIEKRGRILHAALELFAKQGYDGTSLEQVANRADIAVGGIYIYFRSKRQLLLVLMDDLLERLKKLQLVPSSASDVRSAIRGLLTNAFNVDLTYLGAYRAWSEAVRGDRELEGLDRRIRAWTNRRVLTVFERLREAPGARPGVDVAALARTMDVIFWQQLGRAASISPEELREWIDSTTHLIHHALFVDPPPTPRRKSR